MALDEFIAAAGGAKPAHFNTEKKVIVILTSEFDMEHVNQKALCKTIMKLHALKVNIFILGFEIQNDTDDKSHAGSIEDIFDQNLTRMPNHQRDEK